jgi:endoglucanase
VQYIGTKPGVYVLLSIWTDPSLDGNGWPTAVTGEELAELAYAFRNVPYVLYGMSNEPQSNSDGSLDSACWTAMNTTAAAIRSVEDSNGTPHHIITAQGTREWARILDYYVTHPLAADNGDNIAYETHVYDPTSSFQSEFITPASSLPVIIGEFGPVASAGMTTTDTQNLMDTAESLSIPYLAWTFHMRCPPNLLVDNSNGGCGVGMALQPTPWGQQIMAQLAQFAGTAADGG